MRPSEELMLLLELNGFDILKYRLKKQLEFAQEHPLKNTSVKTFKQLLIDHTKVKKSEDFTLKNPLSFSDAFPAEITSLDQFVVNHSDFVKPMTIKSFAQESIFNDIQKESILYDILDQYVDEYREYTVGQMEVIKELMRDISKRRVPFFVTIIPFLGLFNRLGLFKKASQYKRNTKYKKSYRTPSFLAFLLMIIAFLILGLTYHSPETLNLGIFGGLYTYINDANLLKNIFPLYNAFGFFTMLIVSISLVYHFVISRFIKDAREEKDKTLMASFDKWNKHIENERLKQAGLLEDYVDQVLQNQDNTFYEMDKLKGPQALLNKFELYVMNKEKKFDWMSKNYNTLLLWSRRSFILTIATTILFLLLTRWIGV
jgi:hypothetical protein